MYSHVSKKTPPIDTLARTSSYFEYVIQVYGMRCVEFILSIYDKAPITLDKVPIIQNTNR
jgi:hypothetical protein